MKRLVSMVAAGGLLWCGIANSAGADEKGFTLINATGLTIVEIYVSPTATDQWGENILDIETLKNTDSGEMLFPTSEDECLWDLMAKDRKGGLHYWKEIDLCAFEKVTLYIKEGKAWAACE